MTDAQEFVAQRGRKHFQCNFTAGPSPHEFLAVAANGLSGIVDKFTNQKVWSIAKPLPLAQQQGAFYIFATAKYPVANVGGTVGLTVGAIPEGMAGTRINTVFEDSMGWDIASGEMAVDWALQAMQRQLEARFPLNGGWAMIEGRWRYGHTFNAPFGTPAPPPVMDQGSDAIPDDFFSSPRTSRGFGVQLSNIAGADLIPLVGRALQDAWNIEYAQDDINGVMSMTCGGTNRAWPSRQMQMIAAGVPLRGGIYLNVIFADLGSWTSSEANQALNQSLAMITAAVQTRFPGAQLERLRAPGS